MDYGFGQHNGARNISGVFLATSGENYKMTDSEVEIYQVLNGLNMSATSPQIFKCNISLVHCGQWRQGYLSPMPDSESFS